MARKCKSCGDPFKPTHNSMQSTCGKIECAIAHGKKLQQKQSDIEHKQRKQVLRDSDRKWHLKTLKTEFNKFIRLRDAGQVCISCGRTDAEVKQTDGWKTGGAWDCGHYLSVGSHKELQFEEKNAYRQCKSCNGGSGKYTKKNHTVGKQYRINLIKRVGIEIVEWLEGPHEPKKYTIPELKDLIKEYRSKNKALQNMVN